MTRTLLMICPSRGRPHNIERLLEAWQQTTHAAELVVVADADDAELPAYRDVFTRSDGRAASLRVGTRERLGPTLNRVATQEAATHYAVGFLGDDHCPRTTGWDQRFVRALEELGSGFVYGNDLLQGQLLPTAVAVTSDVVQMLGWLVPPGLIHLYIDNAWLYLGQSMGRIRYLDDVIIEHVHPVANKAPWDERYAEVNSAELYATDQLTLQAWLRDAAAEDISKLRQLAASGYPAARPSGAFG